MSKVVQFVRNATDVASTQIGAVGQAIYDLGLNVLRMHDGATPGGFPMLGAKNNLSDLADKAIARTNLGVISSTDQFAVATGTADALVAAFTVPYAVLTDGLQIRVRAVGTNTTKTPTLTVDANAAHTITKLGGQAIDIADIANNRHELLLRYNQANTVWELLNPSEGTGGTLTITDATGTGNISSSIGYWRRNAGSITCWGNVVFGASADGNAVTLNLGGAPNVAANLATIIEYLGMSGYSGGSGIPGGTGIPLWSAIPKNTSHLILRKGGGIGLTNADVAGYTLFFQITYPI